ncbi:MAG: hypothetical protein UHS49_05090 [Faecalimonas sp.]|nr:hypothetical protein [Faecalimonas sp.]
MERFYIRLAEKNFGITAHYAETRKFCRDYLIDEPEQVDYEVQVAETEIATMRGKALRPMYAGCTDGYIEFLALYRPILENLLECRTVLFHGSAIAVDGEVYIFTAPSGTGKSTHTRLWRDMLGARAQMVNDDKPLLRLNGDGSVTVFGTPVNGKHYLGGNVALPLKCVCVIEQARENQIEPVSVRDGFQALFLQTYLREYPRNLDVSSMKRTLEVLGGIMEKPLWRLKCNISREAAKLSYEAMSGKKLEE